MLLWYVELRARKLSPACIRMYQHGGQPAQRFATPRTSSMVQNMGSTSGTVPTLYIFSGSGNSYRIRLLQALLDIDIKHEELDFLVCRL